ncbi:MAG: hypothetical protein HY681_08250 [Chloroflexi bacterium]|nr:hypothetical protein [Chloroflexota bacterium]
MARTYRAVLRGNQLEWLDSPPPQPNALEVRVAIIEGETDELPAGRGQVMAKALAEPAARGAFSSISDPVAWQRELRQERNLMRRDPDATPSSPPASHTP